MIICLEGASAVGKTTTSLEIVKCTNTYVVPEVNQLFSRPAGVSNTWYLERQIDRWQIAKDKSKNYDLVILDGDIFQPLSYNWCFDFKVFNQSLDFIADFYRDAFKNGSIEFPDKYFYLFADKTNLMNRKENDPTRQRRNFETHLGIVKPHQRFYETLNQILPSFVQFIEGINIEENIAIISKSLASSTSKMNQRNSLELMDNIVNWLKINKAKN